MRKPGTPPVCLVPIFFMGTRNVKVPFHTMEGVAWFALWAGAFTHHLKVSKHDAEGYTTILGRVDATDP